ncbi:MAG: N-acetylmuramoyl-L-alanine amidase [Desulfovibrio sp.]|nr:N-acetylmuramoyl-L-alanine amidase [Desulfovibrio sp.]
MTKTVRRLFFSLALLCLPLLPSGPLLDAPAAWAAAQAVSLDSLVKEFNSLRADQTRGGRRDNWLAFEGKFDPLIKGDRESAAEAAFYQARTWEELARRSFLGADHREACARFEAVADKYGKYAVARESLYRQALILKRRLRDPAGAGKALERLVRSYPKSKEAEQAKKILEELRAVPVPADKSASPAQAGARREAPPDRASPLTLKEIRWKGKPQRAVVTLELSRGADYSYAFLPSDKEKKLPARLYLDIAGAFPADSVKSGLRPKDLIVSRIRTGKFGAGTRVTLECDGLACYAVRSPEGASPTIEIEISRKEDIARGIAVAKTGAGVRFGTAKAGTGVRSDTAKAGAGVRSDTAKGMGEAKSRSLAKEPGTVMEQLGLTVKTIMLDPGHGGKDPGAQANGIVERQFTLTMARRIGALLQKEGFTVLYTRTGNSYIPLQDRPDMANNKKADLFISIHVNANTTDSVRGLETYYLDEAKSHNASTVAARENAVSVKNISDLQFILTDLMLGSKLKESHKLADCVQNGILRRLHGAKLPDSSNGVRSAPFYVLMGARMPAILVEFGYITNKEDAANLRSEAFLQRQAEGLVQGLLDYKKELAKMAP